MKPIPLHRREDLTSDETNLLRGYLKGDDFLAQTVNNSSIAMEVPLVFWAASIAQELLGKHTRDTNRRHSQPPRPTEAHQIAALKLVKYVSVSVNDRVDTTCRVSAESIERDRFQTALALMAENDTINVCQNRKKGKTFGVTKRGVNSFLLFDGSRRTSRCWKALTMAQVLSGYKIVDDDEPRCVPDKLKRKQRRKLRIERKKRADECAAEAIKIGKEKRKDRNLAETVNRMNAEMSSEFVSGLQGLLQAEGKDMHGFHDMWEDALFKPFTDTILVGDSDDDEPKKMVDESLVGSDVSAVNYKLTATLLDVITKIKQNEEAKGAKRTRKRGAGQSTKLGGTGVTLGILIQRTNAQQGKDEAEDEKKKIVDEVKKLKTLLRKSMAMKEKNPDDDVVCEDLKGDRLETLARLFGVYRSKKCVQELKDSLAPLNLTQAMIEEKIDELKVTIATKENHLAATIAEIREKEDLINAMGDCDDNNAGEDS